MITLEQHWTDRLCPIVGDRSSESGSIIGNIEHGIESREKIIAQNPEEIAARIVDIQWNEDTVAQGIIRSIVQNQDVLQRCQSERLTTDLKGHVGKGRKRTCHAIDSVLEEEQSSSMAKGLTRSLYHRRESIEHSTNRLVQLNHGHCWTDDECRARVRNGIERR